MISDNKNNPYIKQHDWDKPELTYEMMVQLAVVKEEPVLDDSVDDNISWDFTKPKKSRDTYIDDDTYNTLEDLKPIVYNVCQHRTFDGGEEIVMSTTLGTKINELRKEKKYTLDKLAELTGSSKSYIWELENKNPPRPSAEKVLKIAEQLGVTIEYLLDDEANITVENAGDARFYRKYQQMDEKTKKKIQSFVDMASSKDVSVVVEWIDGHKLNDSAYISMSSREMTDDEIDEQNDPIFTTDKDGYVYVDIKDKK